MVGMKMVAKQAKLFQPRLSTVSKAKKIGLSDRIKKKCVFRVLFTLLCTVVLARQTWEQVTDYLSFETIIMVETEIQRLSIDIPSVSICQKYPLVKVTDNHQIRNARVPTKWIHKMEEYGIIAKHRGFHALDLNRDDSGKASGGVRIPVLQKPLTMEDKFEDISERQIQCLLSCNETVRCYQSFTSVGMMSQCQTYFSEIRSDGKVGPKRFYTLKSEDKGGDISIVAYFAINLTDFYRGKDNFDDVSLYVAIHDTRAPVGSDRAIYTSRRFVIKKNKTYDLAYSRKTIKRLESPYHTDCHKYGSRINSTNIYNHSRELCINQCILDRTWKRFGCLTSYADVIQGDKFSQMNICNQSVLKNYESDDSIYAFEFKSWIDCHKKCKGDCLEETYSFDLNEVDDPTMFDQFQIDYNSTDMAFINVLDKKASESQFYHLPKLKICEVVSNIGGLFSLWLGLSAINIFDFMASVPSYKKYIN